MGLPRIKFGSPTLGGAGSVYGGPGWYLVVLFWRV